MVRIILPTDSYPLYKDLESNILWLFDRNLSFWVCMRLIPALKCSVKWGKERDCKSVPRRTSGGALLPFFFSFFLRRSGCSIMQKKRTAVLPPVSAEQPPVITLRFIFIHLIARTLKIHGAADWNSFLFKLDWKPMRRETVRFAQVEVESWTVVTSRIQGQISCEYFRIFLFIFLFFWRKHFFSPFLRLDPDA